MASLGAVHSVGASLVAHLSQAHQLQRQIELGLVEDERVLPDCSFDQLASAQLAGPFSPNGNQVTLYLYRIGVDRYLRTSADSRTPQEPGSRPLGLELHYLMTAWAGTSAAEHTLMSWAMRELHMAPTLDWGRLQPARLWRRDESVQITPSELSHEDMMRIWDALTPTYRLSVSYIARVVRVDALPQVGAGPVVATRFDIEEDRVLVPCLPSAPMRQIGLIE
jgi:hypothetical protein